MIFVGQVFFEFSSLSVFFEMAVLYIFFMY